MSSSNPAIPPVQTRPSTSSASRPSRSSRSSSGACGPPTDDEARKSSSGSQRVCRYCFQGYSESENRKGSCAEAPDPSASYVEILSCVCCASLFAYHCFADDDGDYEHPCAPYAPASTTIHEELAEETVDGPAPSCDANVYEEKPASERGLGSRAWRKWTLMSVLALCVPCLCLYFPLRACHSWALEHHLAGGKHEAVTARRSEVRQPSRGSASRYSVPEEEEEELEDEVMERKPEANISTA